MFFAPFSISVNNIFWPALLEHVLQDVAKIYETNHQNPKPTNMWIGSS